MISAEDLRRWRQLVAASKQNEFVIARRRRNVERKGISLSKGAIWRALVGCQVTTQQRSGPTSAVARFLGSRSPALRYPICRDSRDVRTLVEEECSRFGLRRGPTVAANLAATLRHLEEGGWKPLRQHLGTLVRYTSPRKERLVVDYLESAPFPGLGPKQTRNFIQWLGLSRYEIPLDSRTLKKLRVLGATFVPHGNSLSDKAVYDFVQTGLQQVSKALGIYPCVLDACIFSSYDAEASRDDDGNDA